MLDVLGFALDWAPAIIMGVMAYWGFIVNIDAPASYRKEWWRRRFGMVVSASIVVAGIQSGLRIMESRKDDQRAQTIERSLGTIEARIPPTDEESRAALSSIRTAAGLTDEVKLRIIKARHLTDEQIKSVQAVLTGAQKNGIVLQGAEFNHMCGSSDECRNFSQEVYKMLAGGGWKFRSTGYGSMDEPGLRITADDDIASANILEKALTDVGLYVTRRGGSDVVVFDVGPNGP